MIIGLVLRICVTVVLVLCVVLTFRWADPKVQSISYTKATRWETNVEGEWAEAVSCAVFVLAAVVAFVIWVV